MGETELTGEEEYDIYRDSLVRYCGYANEVPSFVHTSFIILGCFLCNMVTSSQATLKFKWTKFNFLPEKNGACK